MPILRHLVLGVGLACFGVVTFALLVRSGTPYLLAQVIVHVTAVTLAFPISSRWVFGQDDLTWPALFKFHLSYSLQLPVAALVLFIGVELFGVATTLAQLAGMGAATVVNFVGLRWFVFRATQTGDGPEQSSAPSSVSSTLQAGDG